MVRERLMNNIQNRKQRMRQVEETSNLMWNSGHVPPVLNHGNPILYNQNQQMPQRYITPPAFINHNQIRFISQNPNQMQYQRHPGPTNQVQSTVRPQIIPDETKLHQVHIHQPQQQKQPQNQIPPTQPQKITTQIVSQQLNTENIKFNGSIQIEMKNPPNGIRPPQPNKPLQNCRTHLNQNYSNNQDNHKIPITVQVTNNETDSPETGSETGNTLVNRASGNASLPPKIPQVDGMDDDEDDPAPGPIPVSLPTPIPVRSQRNTVKPATMVLQLGSPGSAGIKKKDKDGMRIGISGSDSRTQRNISPKPKDSSPKQTIVATAKVSKPASPGASCSPTSRPIRVSPSHSGGIRGVSHSPVRAISPSRSSGGTGNTSGSGSTGTQGQQIYRLVNQEELTKLFTNRQPVTFLVNTKTVSNSQPSSEQSASSSTTSQSESAKKPVLNRDKPLLLQDEIDRELAEQSKVKPDAIAEPGTSTDSAAETVAAALPPPPVVDPNDPESDSIKQAKLKVLEAFSKFGKSTQNTQTAHKKTVARPKVSTAQIRKTSQHVVSGKTGTQVTTGQNVISISGPRVLPNQMRIHKGAQPQQIIIQAPTEKVQIIETKSGQVKSSAQQKTIGSGSQTQVSNSTQVTPQSKMDVLRQIQSVKRGGNEKLSFGGKTANMTQIRMITTQSNPTVSPRVLQVSSASCEFPINFFFILPFLLVLQTRSLLTLSFYILYSFEKSF